MQNLFSQVPVNNLDPERVGVVRVLVVGNTGCGKTSLIRCLVDHKQEPKFANKPKTTVGCETHVKLLFCPSANSEFNNQGKPYFVEIWDIGGQARYKNLRPLFYRDINGVILVYDLANSWSFSSLHKWAEEIAKKGSFVAPLSSELASQNFGGLPVPLLIVANKSDLVRDNKKGLQSEGILKSLWQQTVGMLRKGQKESIKRSNSRTAVVCCALNGDVDDKAINDFMSGLIERKFHSIM